MAKLFMHISVRSIPFILFIAILLSCTQKSSNTVALMQIDSLLLKNNYVEAL